MAMIVSATVWVIQSMGYGGVFLLMLLESANIPIPSEVVMPFAGFVAFQGGFSFWAAVTWGAVGNVAGSLLSYYGAGWVIANRGRWKITRLIISQRSIDIAYRWFARWGSVSVFFSRLVPVVRTFISFPAGMAKMRLMSFVIYTAVGSFLWSWFLAWMGYALGTHWDALSSYFHIIDAVVVVGIVAAGAWLWRRRRLRNA